MTRSFQTHRYADAIRKLAGVQGHEGLTLVEDVFNVHDLCCSAPEHYALRDEAIYGVWYSIAAVAAQYSRLSLSLPLGNSRLAVIESIVTDSAAVFGWSSVPGATVLNTYSCFDGRVLSAGKRPSVQVGTDNNAAAGLLAFAGSCLPGQECTPGFVLNAGPAFGTTFGVVSAVVNQALGVAVRWREFHPTDEERVG